MAFRTNAEGKDQERAATRYAAHVGSKAKELDYSVVFSADGVLVVEDGEKFSFTDEEFYRWIDAACPRDASGPMDILPLEGDDDEAATDSPAQPYEGSVAPVEVVDGAEPAQPTDVVDTGDDGGAGPAPELDVPTETAELVDTPEPEGAGDPNPRVEGIVERTNLRNAFHELVQAVYEVLRQEHQGEIGRNAARFRKGQVMTVVEDFKQRAREQGIEDLSTTKDIIAALNSGIMAVANSQGVVDKFNRITENEATITRTVFEKFASDGLDARFELVDAIDEVTGELLARDDGEPIQLPITEVAVNNLYPLAEYATPATRSQLASFAHRYSEKVVKATKKLSKDRSIPILDVVRDINRLRRAVPSPITEQEVSVQADEGSALDWIREQRGEERPSEIINISTERAWFETDYEPLKDIASLVYRTFGLPVDEDTGLISNVKLLERTISQYFSPREYGASRIVAALVDAGDISEARAERFFERWQWDQERGEMVEQEVSEAQAQALTKAIATGEGEVPDDEFEDDTFDGELDLDVEHEEVPAVEQDVGDGLDADDDF